MLKTCRLHAVQEPIIPVIGHWIRETPGTLSLGQGMVNYGPPSAALQAVRDFGSQSDQHLYGSPLGYSPLLRALHNKLKRENGIDCDQGYTVMVTAGSNMAFLSVLMAIADPGDEVILPVPYYFNQEMAVRMLGCVPVTVPVRDDYQLDVDAIAAAISPKTRAVVTISPNNPSGAVYASDDLRRVNALCKQQGIYHISDEAYEYFLYEDAQHYSPASFAGAVGHTISLYSLSKAYGFASWRIGYAVFPQDLLPSLLKVQDTNLICPPLITQMAALGAVQAGKAYCRQPLLIFEITRRQVFDRLQQVADICEIHPTLGAFYVLLKVKTQRSDLELSEALIKQFHVAVIPGSAFGLQHACYLRLSFGMLQPPQMLEAIERLIKGLRALC